jgi:hypothetical protein
LLEGYVDQAFGDEACDSKIFVRKASEPIIVCFLGLSIGGPVRRANRASSKTTVVRDPSPHRLAVTGIPGEGFTSLCSLAWLEYLRIADRNGSLASLGRILPLKISGNGTNLP